MANFAVTNSTLPAGNTQQSVATTYKTLVAIAPSSGNLNGGVSAATGGLGFRRGKVFDLLIGTNGTPADNFMEFDLCRATIGTTLVWLGSLSSVSSAYGEDIADSGFNALGLNNSSAETNIVGTAEPWYVGINQRASYRWVAAPGAEIVYPAVSSGTAGNGVALRVRSGGYTGTATGTVMFSEQ